ncbi:MAG: RidA family protein [Chloroflexia bacterium]|nr:RidA family protein [Chloroflexia bacterium]
MKRHNPDTVSAPSGGYSHAVEVGPNARWLYISGTIPVRPDGVIPDGFDAQSNAIWDNIDAILAAAGMSVANLVKVTTYLTDRSQAALNREIRTRRLQGSRPALTVVVAQTLEAAWLLEIEAVAAAD